MEVGQVVSIFFGAVDFELVGAVVPFFDEHAGLPVEVCGFAGVFDEQVV